jgi:SAM-dependent methyltransferase
MSVSSRTGGLDEDDLAYYSDGVWYDAEYVHIGGDIPYYVRVAEETKGSILELACGTGRLTIPMAEAGKRVTGVDVAPGMIAQANTKRERLDTGIKGRLAFIVGDMRTLRLGERYEAVVLAFNTLMHMIDDRDLEATLETAREHLTETGLFHLDLHTPYPTLMADRDPAGRFDPQQMVDPRTSQRYIVTENNRYDPRTQINHMRFFYRAVDVRGRPTGTERSVELKLRVIFPRELDRWLHLAGFETVGDWDDLERTKPFSGRGGRRVLAVRRR